MQRAADIQKRMVKAIADAVLSAAK